MTTNQEKTVHEKNEELKAQLLARGLYVKTIGEVGKTDYLIVSCIEPILQAEQKNSLIEDNSN